MKRILTSIFILSFLMFFPLPVSAAKREIVGAFGIKFGEKIDNLKIVGEGVLGDYTYEVVPPNPSRPFDKYIVEITPISKRIFLIIGERVGLSRKACENYLNLISSVIENKYRIKRHKEKKYEKDLGNGTYCEKCFSFKKGNRIILLGCLTNIFYFNPLYSGKSYFLRILYIDKKLSEKYLQEKKKLVKKKLKEINPKAF